jgi:antirestriction protein ArdC
MWQDLGAAHGKLQQAVAEIASRRLEADAAGRLEVPPLQLQQPPDDLPAATRRDGGCGLRWKSLGRFVKKGEKGIAIFAPSKYKTKVETDNGEEKNVQQIRGFRAVHVFDISQTEGEDLPDFNAVRPKLLDGSPPEGIWDALARHATSIGYEVVRHQRGTENGYCDFLSKQIAVRPDVSPAQAVKTLIHELGHTLLHAEGGVASRELAEVVVESVAFIVCDALGLDSGGYSFPYVTRWAEGSEELVKQTAERAIGCAKRILERLEVSREGDA